MIGMEKKNNLYLNSRREFLKVLLSLPLSLAHSSSYAVTHVSRDIRLKTLGKKVVVVGAGLAGLTAAYELTDAGFDVFVLEAQKRVGGRVFTMRDQFADGLYAEAGASRIPNNHHRTIEYLKKFNLPLEPFRSTELPDIYYLHGKRVVAKRDELAQLPLDLTADERNLGLAGLRKKYIDSVLEEIGDPGSEGWSPASFRKYDQMTFVEFLKRQGASPDAILLLTIGHNAGRVAQVSALDQLRSLALGKKRKQFYKIRGGNDLLPQSFAERLGNKIMFDATVVKIKHTQTNVRAVYRSYGEDQSVDADYLVSAIPFSVLRRIELSPKLSEGKQKAIEELSYVSCTRIYLQTKNKFWRSEESSDHGLTDLPIAETWDISSGQKSSRGILVAYFTGTSARDFQTLSEPEQIDQTLKQAENLYPGLRDSFEKGVSKCWDDDEWARGAWAQFLPGEMSALSPYVAPPEGRIHFAGEHTSAWTGWMEGAIESGQRVAREIIQKQ